MILARIISTIIFFAFDLAGLIAGLVVCNFKAGYRMSSRVMGTRVMSNKTPEGVMIPKKQLKAIQKNHKTIGA